MDGLIHYEKDFFFHLNELWGLTIRVGSSTISFSSAVSIFRDDWKSSVKLFPFLRRNTRNQLSCANKKNQNRLIFSYVFWSRKMKKTILQGKMRDGVTRRGSGSDLIELKNECSRGSFSVVFIRKQGNQPFFFANSHVAELQARDVLPIPLDHSFGCDDQMKKTA